MTNIPEAKPRVRPVAAADLPGLKAVIDATGLFPSEMLDGMIAGHADGSAPNDLWFTVDDGGPAAVAYAAPERMTQGTWNLLLIAVHPGRQGLGLGTAIVRHVERMLPPRGGRILLVQTSGLPEFERTRAFYRTLGYGEEARIRDYYDAGEDQVTFRKQLGG